MVAIRGGCGAVPSRSPRVASKVASRSAEMRIGYTEERIADHEYPRADEHESHFSKQRRLPIGGRLETDRLLLDRQEPRWVRLVTPRRGFLHHGIYVRHRTVVHYSWLAHGLRRGPVEEVPIARFARGPHIWVRARDPSDFDPPRRTRLAIVSGATNVNISASGVCTGNLAVRRSKRGWRSPDARCVSRCG
jgi:hypothetical protein